MAITNSKISLDELQSLAGFWTEKGDAISVYFRAPEPSELAHREEPIFVKDQIKQKLGSLKGSSPADRADVERIVEAISGTMGNSGRTKVIFACRSSNIWCEFDAPGEFGCRIEVGQAFTLGPLIAQQQCRKRYCIALADRNRARLLLLEAGEISEHSQVLDEGNEKIRTTGTGKSVHLERKKEEQVRRHFTFLAEHLLHFHEHKDYDYLIIGCRDEMWPEIEAELHPHLKRILVGRFTADPGLATSEDIQEKAQSIVGAKDRADETRLIERTIGGFAADGLGAVGLNAVIDALEKGEVRTLLWADKPNGHQRSASVCESCGHLEPETQRACSLCGAHMRSFSSAQEALLRHALGRSIDVREVHYAKLPMPDRIAAWLRFRADVNTPQARAS